MLNLLDSCLEFGKEVVCVDSSASFNEICTKLITEDVSYLPILDHNKTKNVGVYSRKDIFKWLYKKSPVGLDTVSPKLFKKQALPQINSNTKFYDFTNLVKTNSAVLFRNSDGQYSKFISPRVLANVLDNYSNKYITLENLEISIREFLNDKGIELNKIKSDNLNKELPTSFEMLDFGQYITVISKCWDDLNLNYDKKSVIALLTDASSYRNSVMHFRLTNENEGLYSLKKLLNLFSK